MNALLLLLLALTPQAPPRGQAPPPRNPINSPITPSQVDGKVTGLNETVFRVLQKIKEKNSGALIEIDAYSIKAAVLQPEKVKGDAPPPPGKIDVVERDLLEELTSPTSRRITITLGTTYEELLVLPSATGNAREILREALYPVPNYEYQWHTGLSGFQVIVNDYKNSPSRRERIITFVQSKLAREWVTSNAANGYKPLRNLLTELNSYISEPGTDTTVGRTILYKAMQALDKATNNRVPDSLYNSLKT